MKSSELVKILQKGIEEHGDKELYFHNSFDGETLELVNIDYDWDNAEECFVQFNGGFVSYQEIKKAVDEVFGENKGEITCVTVNKEEGYVRLYFEDDTAQVLNNIQVNIAGESIIDKDSEVEE